MSFVTPDQITIFAIISVAVFLFIIEKWRYDVVSLLALFAAVVSGVVPAKDAFSGFADPVVVTVGAILVISAAISRSGAVDYVMRLLSHFAEKPKMQIFVMVGLVMVLSAFMNNVGALAIFLPIAITFAKRANRKPSELLMPLSFGSLLGGLVTLIGTPPNLLISRIRQDMVGTPYHMFDFAPVGLGICVFGLIYLCFGWRLLPKDRRGQPSAEEQFAIEDYLSEVEVGEDSKIIGKNILEIEQLYDVDFSIIGVIRNNHRRLAPSGRLKVIAGDVLLIESDPVALKALVDGSGVKLAGSKETETITITSEEVGVVEAVVQVESQLIGLTPRQLHLRSRFSINLLAARQAGVTIKNRLRDIRFKEGDVVVLQGPMDAMAETLSELGCLPLAERSLQLGRKKFMFLPAVILAIAVAITIAGVLPISIAFLGAVLAIAMLRIMRLNEMYSAIDGSVLILLAAMIPVTNALQTTGGTELIASTIALVSNGLSGPVLIGLIITVSMIVTPFLNNAAAVLLMAPIAGALAMKLGLNIDPFLMAVAIGTSSDFLTPIGHQSNTLVMGPGGYKFTDYWRLGLPLSILIVVVGTPLILMFWPLHG